MPRTKPTITYKKKDGIAIISMNRPEYNNAQNGKMTYDLDKFFKRAIDDDGVKVIVLKVTENIFLPAMILELLEEMLMLSMIRKSMWYDHTIKARRRIFICKRTRGIFKYVQTLERYAKTDDCNGAWSMRSWWMHVGVGM